MNLMEYLMVDYNQYQDIFKINKNTYIIDYLDGNLMKYTSSETFNKIFCKDAYNKDIMYGLKLKNIKPAILYITLIPTYKCNMKCNYCYEDSLTTNQNTMKYSDINRITKDVIKIYQDGNYTKIEFILLGGEPLTEPNLKWFYAFFSNFKPYGIDYKISCISNGLEIRRNLKLINKIGLTNIQLTLDGLDNVHNKRKKSKIKDLNPFHEVIFSVDELLKNRVNVNLRINIDLENIYHILEINNLINNKKWNKFDNFNCYIYPITHSSKIKNDEYLSETEILEKVLDQLKTIKGETSIKLDFHGISFIDDLINNEIFIPMNQFCSSCSSQFVFDSNGKIYTCWWGSGISDFIVGNFKNHTIDTDKIKIWNNHDVNNIEKCINCKYKYICGTGCVYKSYTFNGTLNSGYCSNFYENIKLYLSYLENIGTL